MLTCWQAQTGCAAWGGVALSHLWTLARGHPCQMPSYYSSSSSSYPLSSSLPLRSSSSNSPLPTFPSSWTKRKKSKKHKRFVEITTQAIHDSHETYHRLASDFDEAEEALNEGLGCMHKVIEEMNTATSAMSIGTDRRQERERAGLFKEGPRPAEQGAK